MIVFAAIPEDALNDESDNEDKENPDSRISSKYYDLVVYLLVLKIIGGNKDKLGIIINISP